MKIQDEIIAWNNQAVTLLQNGQFRQGLALLRVANRHLVRHMDEEYALSTATAAVTCGASSPDSQTGSSMVSYNCTSELRTFDRSKGYRSSMTTSTINNPVVEQEQGSSQGTKSEGRAGKYSSPSNTNLSHKAFESDEDNSYIYQRFIRVVRTPDEQGDYILSFIVLFNIGLTYQLQVVHGDYERHPLHTQQRRLWLCHESFNAYRCAFAMKNHGRIRMDTLILLALTNNMCHLSVALRMTDQANHLRELLTIALVTKATAGDDDEHVSNSGISLDGFWKTALTTNNAQWKTVPLRAGAA
jgi:hypothetical protein